MAAIDNIIWSFCSEHYGEICGASPKCTECSVRLSDIVIKGKQGENVYHMFLYAFQILSEQGYEQILTEKFDNTAELCSALLAKGVVVVIQYPLKRSVWIVTFRRLGSS